MKKALVAGAGGFIGGFLVKRLLSDGVRVRAVDIKPFDQWYQLDHNATNLSLDLKEIEACRTAIKDCDAVFNLAADMGGMGFIETHKADCMLSVLINTNLLRASIEKNVDRYFYASSACVYAADKQKDPDVTALKEADAYPAMPEDGYGWEKLFSERMCRHFMEDYGLPVRVARFHNVYGPHGTYDGGREKAPAAICRKVIEAKRDNRSDIDVWGNGEQTRSFMYIDDCIEGIMRIFNSQFSHPLNLGSSELVSINDLVDLVADIAGIKVQKIYDLSAPQGVRGRNSDNTIIKAALGWEPSIPLRDGLQVTYNWIEQQVCGGKP